MVHFFISISAYVTCPESYLCEDSEMNNVSMCVVISHVCDGKIDCPLGDDEIECGEYNKYNNYKPFDFKGARK